MSIPCNYILDSFERAYLQLESTWGTVPNASGVASLAGSNCCRIIECDMNPTIDLYTRADKTGTFSYPPGTRGRERGDWRLNMSLAGNGVAGVKPDCDVLLQCALGQAGAVVASTSVTYSLSNVIPSCSIWSFRTDTAGTSNPNQRVSIGSVVNSMTFHLNENIATAQFDGTSHNILGSFDFAARTTAGDTAGQGGLTAFPSEPSTPVTNGNAVQGFYGALTMDGQSIQSIRSADIKFELNRKNSQVFGTPYPGCPIAGRRRVTFACDLYDASDAATKDLYQRAYDKNTFGVTMQIGVTPGNIWTINLSGLQLAPYQYSVSDETYSLKFGDSSASSTTGNTESTIVLT